ncbi:unnamed protein product [Rangifer tarandus platyrhynchus]|uniref:Uncharacterized protein n=2 Tax=Rangifer tarandus platyrhynchus TaxID=3082113 RepID=A0AC60A0Q3_RANTA|nr:unnamed protein product [Rangifer tarandus platyrhynchus]
MITTVKLIKMHPSLHTVTFVCVVRTLRVLTDFKYTIWHSSLVAQMVKNLPAMQETQVIPGSRRFPGEGYGNPFQYSRLENSMDRGAWWATVHGITKSRT